MLLPAAGRPLRLLLGLVLLCIVAVGVQFGSSREAAAAAVTSVLAPVPARVAIVFLTDSPASETLSFASDVVTQSRGVDQRFFPRGFQLDVFLLADNSTWQPSDASVVPVVPVASGTWSRAAIGLLQYDVQTIVLANFTGLNSAVHAMRRKQAEREGTTWVRGPTVGAWEKAMYAALRDPVLGGYSFVWFAEQDVFIPSVEALHRLTALALQSDEDYVSAPISAYQPHLSWGYWYDFDHANYPRPWYRGQASFVGLSRTFLNVLDGHRDRHGKFFFLEAFLPTVAVVVNTTRILLPLEMATVGWTSHDVVTLEDIVRYPHNIYHPIRKLSTHTDLREALKSNPAPVWKQVQTASPVA